MPANDRPKIRCYVIIPSDTELNPIRTTMKSVSKEVNARLVSPEDVVSQPSPLIDLVYSEITKSDLVIAEVSQPKSNTFYEIGIAHALGKPVVFLIQEDVAAKVPFDLRRGIYILYSLTPEGLSKFRDRFRAFLKEFLRAPQKFRSFQPFRARIGLPPYIIDLEKLEPREFENLCFELITQMGFRRVEWGKEFREVDAVATLSKKDPDGYEYQELWLISMGRRTQAEMLLERAIMGPEDYLHRLLRFENFEELFSKYKLRYDVPITILFILRREEPSFEHDLRHAETYLKERRSPVTVRIRWWDTAYLTNLIQQYPQIAFKYFSEEARVKSKYRKTPEELYNENVKFSEELIVVKNQLEEEKKKRFVAERDAAWKDVAFKAAHKLGNPIDAVDTYLQSLRRRIQNNLTEDALNIANEMDAIIEEAKTVIAQFKSLTKSEEIKLHPIDLLPLIHHVCKIAEENGVNVTIQAMENLPQVMIDPERMTECFNELISNAIHWFDKQDKRITVMVDKVSKKDLPEGLNTKQQYLRVRFEDNGCGVQFENKEKIFAPFYTTNPHGTGLGLSLVKRIVEGHGGQIHEIGKPGEGATFEMYLPLAKKRKEE